MSRRGLAPVVIVAMLLFAVLAYPSLPDRIPTHWNVAGEVDGWSSKSPGAFFFVFGAAGIWLLLQLLRRVDPRRAHYERFEETYWLILNVLVLFLALMQTLTLGYALGWPVDMTRAVLLVLGLFFLGLGNYLPRVRSNWWMGIRTPWTLENEQVWRETHRLGGRTFVVGGLLTMVAALLPTEYRPWLVIGAVGLAALVPAVYSYVLWRRLQREKPA